MTKEEKAAKKAAITEQNKAILAAWAEEKKAKKQAKKDARALRKARMKARPFWQKLLGAFGNIIVVCLILGIVGTLMLPAAVGIYRGAVKEMYYKLGYQEPDMEAERAITPADTQAQEAINAMTGYDKDDTWAIYMYIVGSNLESHKQNDLSGIISTETGLAKQENSAQSKSYKLNNLQTYSNAIYDAGLELPGPMYYINAPKSASDTPVTEKVVVSTDPGAVTMDLDEIFKVALPENISMVIQTGGSTHWDNARINPNRVQTFVYSSNGLDEERNMPVYNMATADALADFLSYCQENHAADHQVLILWDHGGGAFGFGIDEIYGSMMGLKDIKEALSSVYTANVKSPAFELIGFDACLMASAEVMDTLEGYGKYFVGSEETEPGFGWFYTEWLTALKEDSGMNGAQLGLSIADSYMDFYARMNRSIFGDIGIDIFGMDGVTFSVLDIHKAAQVYDSYISLMESVLAQTTENNSVLTDVCEAAKSAIHYGGADYDILNTIDLGTFLDSMPDSLSAQTTALQTALDDAVLYVRSASAAEGSSGLTVYFPDNTSTYQTSIIYMMDYITSVSDSEALNALYFYKAAGCLTEEMKTWLSENGYGELEALDLTALKSVEELPMTLNEGSGFTVAVPKEAQDRMTGVGLSIGVLEDDKIIYYGTSADAALTEQGELTTGFDGKWICLDGQPLSVEVVFNGAETITYHSTILLGKEKATLVFSYDKSTAEFNIVGAYCDSMAIDGDIIGRNVSDLNVGSTITAVYRATEATTMSETSVNGKPIRYGLGTKISLEALPNGNYLSMISFGSIRGDEFNTGTVEFTVSGRKITEMNISETYTSVHNR